jgi:hypothetical protein
MIGTKTDKEKDVLQRSKLVCFSTACRYSAALGLS